MKLDKRYYCEVIEELSKLLLKNKDKLSQILEEEMKEEEGHKIRYFTDYLTDYLDISITFEKKVINK